MERLVLRKPQGRTQLGRAERQGANLPEEDAERRERGSLNWRKWELLSVMASSLLRLFIWRWPQTFHFHVAHVYAHLGYPSAQHIVGQRYLKGAGGEKNEEMAMRWFGQASRRGHPHASFHPAVGKLKNGTVALEEGEVKGLLQPAAGEGLWEAQALLENLRRTANPPPQPRPSRKPPAA